MKVLSVGKKRPVNFSLGEHLGAVKEVLSEMAGVNISKRLWDKDPKIWRNDVMECELIKDSLGWLSVPGPMRTKVERLNAFANKIKAQGYKHVVVLGMGGSSLAIKLFADTFGVQKDYPTLLVLDSTDPDSIISVKNKIELTNTIFIVSSKSGSTMESLTLLDYFYALLHKKKGPKAGENFIAITNESSPLTAIAKERKFKKVYLNPDDIGGRFSALSYFGLVPAALAGIDIDSILASALEEVAQCGAEVDIQKNPALILGGALGALFRRGRDKVTFLMSDEVKSFGLWLEQLLAESTGKDGVGLVPIVNEPIGDVEDYGKDRVFVHIGMGFLEEHEIELLYYLEGQGHPIISIRLDDIHDLGGEIFRWELATAAAGFVMGINPFDQPDVETAKKLTRSLLESVDTKAAGFQNGITLKAKNFEISIGDSTLERIPSRKHKYDLTGAIQDFFGLIKEGDYISLLSYTQSDEPKEKRILTGFRFVMRDLFGTATQLGYGPSYLHSTGQLHKGGADNGIFLLIFRSKPGDPGKCIQIPRKKYTFFDLESAQANGDLAALQAKGRRAALITVTTNFEAAMNELHGLIASTMTSKA